MAADLLALDGDVSHIAALDLGDEVGEGEIILGARIAGALEHVEQHDQQETDDHPQRDIPPVIIHVLNPMFS